MLIFQIMAAVITFLVYTSFFSWKIALLVMFAVGFHEGCHLLAAKMRGLKTGGFFLMPFIGGVALIQSRYKTYWDQALIVLAGPLGGGAMAALFAIAYLSTGVPIIGVAAMWMLFLNAFNLLPISFMDGGQLMGTLTYSWGRGIGLAFKAASLVLGGIILFYMHVGFLLVFIAWFGGREVYNEYSYYKAFKNGDTWLCPDTYLLKPIRLTKPQMFFVAGMHLATFVAWVSLLVYMAYRVPMSYSSVLN
jgi:Zn-dependent protease